MDFNEYEIEAEKSALYDRLEEVPWLYPALGLASESGEVLGKLKKIFRDKRCSINYEDKVELEKELGDVLWYISRTARELGLTLDGIAKTNIKKLAGRLERGTVKGSGDNR